MNNVKCNKCGTEFSYSVLPIHQEWCNQITEETPTRKDLNVKLKSLGYEGDLRKLTDEDVIAEIRKLENK